MKQRFSRSGELDKYVKFYPSDKIPDIELLGYDDEGKAGLALGLSSQKSDRCLVLLFGIPGCGKTKFPYHLCRKLNGISTTEKFSLLHIKCDPLSTSTRSTGDIINVLGSGVRIAHQHLPTIIILDEFDSMTTAIADSGERASELTRWLRDLVEESPSKVLLVGTTNNPQKIDFSIRRRIRASLFFDVTPQAVIAEIIKRSFGRTDAEDIRDDLYRGLGVNDFIPLASDVEWACEWLKTHHSDLGTIPREELSKRLVALTPGLESETIEQYRQTNANLINRSSGQMEYWIEELARLGL